MVFAPELVPEILENKNYFYFQVEKWVNKLYELEENLISLKRFDKLQELDKMKG